MRYEGPQEGIRSSELKDTGNKIDQWEKSARIVAVKKK